ncbi:recombinase family protein [Cytobacillus oceanisediminis]|uniref:recombinase family protein n=1 Tax=Cytobacillus oceanisediminis TaxID=665099 RepID=UPI001C229ADB|nr:recombinase family protein [Cytobacillus oceanisediminis]MBU8732545.1 recombinase family protein [Cytobacillus oceanisediminis]
MIIGYARVSTVEQNLDRQLVRLKEFGCEYIVEEKLSGEKRDNRVELESLIKKLRFKDVVVVTELSRLARSLQDLLNILSEFKNNKVDFVSIKENIDTREDNIYSKFMLQIMGAIAEFERDLIKERQKEGIQIAKSKGIYKGRKIKYHPKAQGHDKLIYDIIVNSLMSNESVAEINRKTGVARNTIYRIKKEIEI